MAKYKVTLYYHTNLVLSVDAESEQQARYLAEAEAEKECYIKDILDGLQSEGTDVDLDEDDEKPYKPRTLKIGEVVYYVGFHDACAKAKVVSINGQETGEVAFDGTEEDTEVKIELLEDLEGVGNKEDVVSAIIPEIYQIAEGKTFKGEEVCYEHVTSIDYPYYCPMREENVYNIELD